MPHFDDRLNTTGREPLLNAPRVVVWLIGLLVVVHLVRALLPAELDWLVIETFGVIPARYTGTGDMPPSFLGGHAALLVPLIGYALLHGDIFHLGFNAVWLLALGSPVAWRIGVFRFVAFFVIAALAGIGFYILVNPTGVVPVIGASGAISGLFGAIARLLFSGHGLAALSDRRVMVFAALWLLINLIFGISGFGVGTTPMPIAWEAHVGGFLAGLLLFPLFDRRVWAGPVGRL